MLTLLVLFYQRAGCVEVASNCVVQPIYRLPVGPGDQMVLPVPQAGFQKSAENLPPPAIMSEGKACSG